MVTETVLIIRMTRTMNILGKLLSIAQMEAQKKENYIYIYIYIYTCISSLGSIMERPQTTTILFNIQGGILESGNAHHQPIVGA